MRKRDEWVRVKSESELRAGMCVELRPCRLCGRAHRFFISAVIEDLRPCVHGTHDDHARLAIGSCEDKLHCWCASIREGRLYRLSDSQLTDSEETRELERVR